MENTLLPLLLSFPSYPVQRIFHEAILEHNLLNADDQLDEHTPWPGLCNAVVAMLRHRFSNYDQVVTKDNRDQLRAEILAAARCQYPWLRPELSPIITRAKISRFDKRPGEKYLDYLSRVSGEFLTERNRIDLALSKASDAQTRIRLRARRAQITQLVTTIYEICTHDIDSIVPVCRMDHIEGRYNLEGLGSYRLQHTGISCPRCAQAILQTKTEVSVGQGRRMLIISCYCVSVLIHKSRENLRFCLRPKGWEEALRAVYGQDTSQKSQT